MSAGPPVPPGSPQDPHPGVSAGVALVAAFLSFFALALMGLGMLSYLTATDIIAVPGLGQAPGVIGMILALVVFALGLLAVLRPDRPRYPAVLWVGLSVALVHLVAVWVTALVTGAGPVTATAAAGSLLTGGATLVVLGAALVAAWAGVALRRTRARAPQWPWEGKEDEE